MKHEYLILGAGPAGIQLGYFLQRAGRDYLILERGESAGTFFKTFPRHRKLISINKVFTGQEDPELNMRWDWNSLITDDYKSLLQNYTKEYFPHADDLVKYLEDFAQQHQLQIRYGTTVSRVWRDEEGFHAEGADGATFDAECLIVATGIAKPYIPQIPGIELAEQYNTVSVDADTFENQRVLIIGKGNSAFETADHLVGKAAVIHVASPEYVTFAWQSHYVGHLRAVNNNFLDTYLLKSQNAVLEATIEKIDRDGDGFLVDVEFKRAKGERATYHYDRVIACTGFRMDTDLYDESCRPEMDSKTMHRMPRLDCRWQSVNVPDMFFAGALMQQRDFKKTTSAFIHGFRYNIRVLFHYLESRRHGVSWPCEHIPAEDLGERILSSINRSSAVWQQFGFLGDLAVANGDANGNGDWCYYEGVPVDYAHAGDLTADAPYYVVTLEYGKVEFDPLRDDRISQFDADFAADSTALHPVVRFCRNGEILAEHHLVEHLEAVWSDRKLHLEPLSQFLTERGALCVN